MTRPFRFGWQITAEHESTPDEPRRPVDAALQAEAIGFDVVLSSDHVGPGDAPLPQLAAMAAATSTISVGTFVLNADMRNPVQLAWEAGTIHRMSGGRFELGLGAGHTPHEYAETGIELHPAAVRKAALAERIEIIRRLFDGETVDWAGEHHHLSGAHIDSLGPDRLPILVGGNGDALLAHAARHADIIGLQGLGRTLDDGHRHTVQWSTEHLDAQVAHVRASAGARADDLELNALVQIVTVTEDSGAAADARADVLGRVEGLTSDQLNALPYVLIGSASEIVDKLQMCRERWGITYFAVRELDDFAPVINACRSASA
jgi:probable F420-dependent oxidoreductase